MQIPHTEIVVVRAGLELVRRVVPPGEYTIGREADCAIHVEDEGLSRRHARLTINYDHALIEDLASSNGTFVNEQSVTSATRLWPNQKIRVGPATTITLRRLKGDSNPAVSLAPAQAAVHRNLPEEFLRDKKYEIGGVVAQGGMGAILHAREATTERGVAMKVMLETLAPEDVVRFIGEAKVTAQLEHPNIVPIYELSVDENEQVFYTMKFVRGVTLGVVLTKLAAGDPEMRKRYPLPQLLTIFQKVCDGMAFAHNKRVIHRDLKPDNIMLGDFGEVLVMDWGLAKVLGRTDANASAVMMRSLVRPAADAAASVTMAGTVMGTPHYMSPEQARGEVEGLDARTDVYALGAILYHILALRPPVGGEDAWAVVRRVAAGEIEPLTAPAASKTRVPESLAAVVRKALAFERDRRYASVEALQRDVEAYQSGFATSAENAGLFKQLALLIKRHKGIAATALAAWLMITVLAVCFVVKVTAERNRAERALADLRKTAPTFFEEARLLTEQEKLPDALAKIDSALQLVPEDARFHNQRGNILQSMERFGEAAEAYATSLRLNPQDAVAKANIDLSKALAENKNGNQQLLTDTMRRKWRDALQQQGRHSEAIFVGKNLFSDAKKMLPSWQARIDAWLGKDAPRIVMAADGYELHLEARSLSDLSPLRGMPVRDLMLDNNFQLKDLAPLADCPLERLYAGNIPNLADLSPLREKDFVVLYVSSTNVSNLDIFRGKRRLENLAISKTQVTDLSPIKDAHLKIFAAEGTRIRDLSPLRGQPLEGVYLGATHINSLEPLADAPLIELNLEGCGHLDLAALKGRKLQRLAAAGTTLDHLEILAEMIDLEVISLPLNMADPGLLRKLPHLRNIDTHGYSQVGGKWENLKNADEFWKEYDAQKARGTNE